MVRDQLLSNILEKRLSNIEKRVGEEIRFEGAVLTGINRISLRGVRLGADRWVHIQRVDVTLKSDSLLSSIMQGKLPDIQWVYLMQPTILVKGRSLKALAQEQQKRVKRLVSRFFRKRSRSNTQRSKAAKPTPSKDHLAALPHIEISGGKISGAQGLLYLHQGNLSIRDGRLKGSWRGEAPQTGYCTIEGGIDYAKVACRDHFKVPVGRRFEIAGKQLEWKANPTPVVHLRGLHLTELSKGTKSLPFSEVKVDIVAGLTPNLDAQFPLEAALVFPGGGRLIANGFASPQELELSTEVTGFPMYTLAQGQSGTLNANARVWARWQDGAATFEGRLGLKNAIIRHPKLAEGPVGPLDLSADGTLRLAWVPQQPRRFRISVSDAKAQIGDISGRLSATWDQFKPNAYLNADFEVPSIKAERFAASIPEGLMPHLQPINLAGYLGFSGKIDLDFAHLDKTVLKFKPKLRRLKVRSFNEEIDFQALNGSFDTRFEMPNGTVLTRVTGPETERWIELNEMPKLLPLAVTSQEDGGFYKHGGISLFHLRGSLVRNLKEGRFVRGGSTLTMQLIKNLYLHRKKTLSRKLEEVCLAWLIERRFSKDELITLYLNIVEFGPNLFGIKEASKHYFNKKPIDLIPEEISAITRLLPGPRLYAPFFKRKKLTRSYTNRVNRLLKLLQKRKYISAEDWEPITPTSLWEVKAIEPQEEDDPGQDLQDPSFDPDYEPKPLEVSDPF